MGDHIIKAYSSTQTVVALSSGEAEFYGITKGASVALGVRGMALDMGITFGIDLYTDASAAKGITNRIGPGKVRHLETNQLWIQSKVAEGSIAVHKVNGSENPADALTKHLTSPLLTEHCHMINIERTNIVQSSAILAE